MTQATATASSTGDAARKHRERRMGFVVSDSRHKSLKVEFRYLSRHPKYGKYMRRRTTLHVHDENNEAHVGDKVEVEACRRISKTKCWRLVRIVDRAAV